MKSDRKTKNELIKELESVRRKLKKMETQVAKCELTELASKQLEKALWESTMNLAESQRIGKLGFWDWDIAENSLSWSDEIYRIWGVERNFPLNFDNIAGMIHPDDRERNSKNVQELLAVRDKGEFEFRIICPYGTVKYIYQSIEVTHAPSGQPIRMFGIMQDITDRKRAEEALRESEEKFRAMADLSPAAIAIQRNDEQREQFLYVNEAWETMTGYSQDDAMLLKPNNIIHPDMRTLVAERAAARLRGEDVPSRYENKIITKSGEVKWWDFVAKVIRYQSAPTILTMALDISDRKRAEEVLKENELKFRTVADFTYDWEYWENENRDIVYVSPSCERMTGYSRQEFIADPTLLEKIMHPEDVDYVKRLHENKFTSENKNDVDELEFRIIRKDGSVVPIYHVCRPVYDEFNKYHGRRISNRDITERKRVEEALRASEVRFRELFNHMSSGVAIYKAIDNGEDFIFRDFNPAAERIEKINRKDILGRRVTEIFFGVKTFGIFEVFQRVWRTGKTEYFPQNIYKKDEEDPGTWRESWIFKLPTDEIVAIYNDITERKWAEEEIRKSHEELRMLADHLQNIREEERNRLAREFHDQLGQSMTALKMDLSLLLRTISDEKQDISRTNIAGELKSAKKLIDEMNQLIWEIIADLRPQMLDDLGLLAALEWETEGFELRTGITCEFKSTAGDIQIDSKKSIGLFRIYQEVLTNITRHANATVVKSILRRDDEMLVFEIKDDGRGITLNEQSKSNSFGLIGMRERAMALGGQLKISGIAGEGTTIIVRLPLK